MVTILSRPAAANNWASDEYAAGRRERKVGAILHWMAGYLPGTTGMFQNPSTGYATSLGVGSRDGRGNGLEVHRYVPADGYAYGSFNSYADRRGESIEIENDVNLPYPGKPTPAVHELVARLLAQLCVEENWPLIRGKRQLVLGDFPDHRFYQRDIPGFGVDFNVTTHRSMAIKDCPGSTDVAWIVARANQFLAGPVEPERRKTMTTLYVITKDDKRPGATAPASNFERWALAGDGAGAGAWLETADLNLANDWSVSHGRHVWLTKATFASFRGAYTSGQPVSGGIGGGAIDYAALGEAIAKHVPTTITGSLS